jgi:beta-glucosidase
MASQLEQGVTMYDVFSLPPIKFPEGFLWGSSTAAHQVEGDNIHSQLWSREVEGKGGEPSGKACNHYELYKQDVELIAELGHQVYRLSIEWSRIEPEEGRWNEAAVAHYMDLLERLKAKGIKNFVTLHHFTHPLWFEKLGAFNEAKNLRYFERFCDFITKRIAHLVDGWNVINEFNLDTGVSAEKGRFKFNMIRAHARGYHVIRQYSKAPISSAHAFVHWFPRRRHDVLDNRMTEFVDTVTHEFFFHAIRTGELVFPYMDAEYDAEVKGAMDFWAVNYYTRHMVDARKAKIRGKRFDHKSLKLIPMENFFLEEFFPEGLIANLERLKDLPVYITENGCACNDDRFRIVYIALHMSALAEAIERGVDVRGYIHWSLMDNYEWGSYLPRFGLVDVDFKTFQRTPKPSAWFFRDIIRANGMNPAMIRQYLKELPTLAPPA